MGQSVGKQSWKINFIQTPKSLLQEDNLILLATVKCAAAKYPHLTLGRLLELAEKYGELIEFDERGQPFLNEDIFAANVEGVPDYTDTINDSDLTHIQKILLDRLAAKGDGARVRASDLLEGLDITPTGAGKIFSGLEKQGYVAKLQSAPYALWTALEDSRGNPPKKIGGAA